MTRRQSVGIEPDWLRIARRYLGEREVAGAGANPTIGKFFARAAGKAMTEETPWCAAFVGACLAEAGEESTGKLNARSYLAWGAAVEETDARPGDICVFRRGKSAWQGHVAFFLRFVGDLVEVLGGNQSDAVTVARYRRADLLGIRRPAGADDTRPARPAHLTTTQRQLDALGYHVGAIDGVWGSRTRGAVLAFRADNRLPLSESVTDADFLHALFVSAPPRPIAPERATASLGDLRARDSRTVGATDALKAAGGVMATVGAAGGVAKQSGILDQVEDAGAVAQRVNDAATPIRDLVASFAGLWWIPALVLGLVVVHFAVKAARARLADYRSGRAL